MTVHVPATESYVPTGAVNPQEASIPVTVTVKISEPDPAGSRVAIIGTSTEPSSLTYASSTPLLTLTVGGFATGFHAKLNISCAVVVLSLASNSPSPGFSVVNIVTLRSISPT